MNNEYSHSQTDGTTSTNADNINMQWPLLSARLKILKIKSEYLSLIKCLYASNARSKSVLNLVKELVRDPSLSPMSQYVGIIKMSFRCIKGELIYMSYSINITIIMRSPDVSTNRII